MDGLAREPAIFSEERDHGPQELTGYAVRMTV